jgi:peptide-methionine (S)-S-oxide reductase
MNLKTILACSLLLVALAIGLFAAQGLPSNAKANPLQDGSDTKPMKETLDLQSESKMKSMTSEKKQLETASFGAGCFWCVEAVFQKLKGVEEVESGYMGGHTDNPTYKQICTGSTGHAEIIQIKFDPEVISFKELLEVFWKTHDPTTLNRQGNDRGTQYRSAVFFHDDKQKDLAETYKEKLNHSGAFSDPIVTEITAASKYYPAEKYHQNYWNTQGKGNRYCQAVIPPKLEKLKAAFADKLKDQ